MSRYINADKMIADSQAMKKVADSISIDGIIEYVKKNIENDVKKVIHCKDCKYCVPLDRNCELNGIVYKHCTEWHGEETKNVWHKYKKYYKDYSVVEMDGFCSFAERNEQKVFEKEKEE